MSDEKITCKDCKHWKKHFNFEYSGSCRPWWGMLYKLMDCSANLSARNCYNYFEVETGAHFSCIKAEKKDEEDKHE